MRREIPVEEAIGMVLAHDLTRIVPGEFKGRVFQKGHVISMEDIPLLLDIGKRHIYVLELNDDEMHEDDAAMRMAEAIGGGAVVRSDVHEGKVVLKAAHAGMLWVDGARVTAMNMIDDICVSTRLPMRHVDAGTSVAAVRPIPLVILREKVAAVCRIAEEASMTRGIVNVIAYPEHRVHLITTGSEILTGRIVDKSGPILRDRLAKHGLTLERQVFVGDDESEIATAIEQAVGDGATVVLLTGGMSVDPDDRTPSAIRRAATRVVTYGTPMLPGSMMMLAYRGETAIFGLPGAVVYDAETSFDMLLPRVLAGFAVTKQDIAGMGVGGWLNA